MIRLAPSVREAVGAVAALLLRALAATWRVRIVGRDPMKASGQPAVIAAFWHEHALVMAAMFRDREVSASVSHSRDGDLIHAVLTHLGYAPAARGSSSRGAVGLLRELVRRVDAGGTAAIPVDGPRGPAHEAKPGVIALAAITGIPISPVRVEAHPAVRFASWDRTMLPWPFARIVLRFEEGVVVDRELTVPEREARRTELETRLSAPA